MLQESFSFTKDVLSWPLQVTEPFPVSKALQIPLLPFTLPVLQPPWEVLWIQ